MARKTTFPKLNGSDGAEKSDANLTPLEHIEEALRGLRYGSVTVFVQDGNVVLVERTEKRRVV